MPVIQCPGCKKKLKLKALKEGAKVKCPGCAEIFRPQVADGESAAPRPAKPRSASAAKPAAKPAASPKAASAAAKPARKRPVKKKRPAPVDDFDDFGDDDFGGDDYGDADDFDQPAPRRSGAGGRKAAKKKPAPKKSKTPLIVGIAVVAIAAIGGGAFWLLGGDSDEGGNEANVADTGGEDAGGEVAGENAGDVDEGQANVEEKAPAQPSPVDLKWMPASTEGLVHIKVPQLLSGPLGAFVQSPQLAPQIEQFKAIAGFGPENIDSITVGVSRISEMSQLQTEPNPESMSLIAVVRANQSIDASKLSLVAPQASQVTEGSLTYYRIPEDPPVAIWMPDDRTAVVGAESVVLQVAKGNSATSSLDSGLLNGQSSIEIAFSPVIPDAIFRHPNFRIPEGGPAPVPPPVRTLVAAMKDHVVGASIGITLTQDIGFNTAFRCRDAAGAAKFKDAYQATMEELKKLEESNPGQGIPPQLQMLMVPFKQIGDDMNESFQVTASGTLTSSSMEAKGGGQTLAGFVPMLAAFLPPMSPAGPPMVQPPARDNMKQIAMAMHYFHDAIGRFPNATGKGPDGSPLLSWRVHLLPYLGHEDLYNKFALEESWDSPTNGPLVNQMPDVYRSPEVNVSGGKTVYMVPTSPGTAFEGETGRSMRDFSDGTSNTILLVEVETLRAVEWTRPVDYSFNPSDPLEGLLPAREEGYKVVFVDGSVQTIAPATSPQEATSKFTRAAAD